VYVYDGRRKEEGGRRRGESAGADAPAEAARHDSRLLVLCPADGSFLLIWLYTWLKGWFAYRQIYRDLDMPFPFEISFRCD